MTEDYNCTLPARHKYKIEFLDGSFPPCLHCASRLHTSRNFPHAASFSKHCGRASELQVVKLTFESSKAVTFKKGISSTHHKNISGFQNCWSFFLRVKSAPKGQYIYIYVYTYIYIYIFIVISELDNLKLSPHHCHSNSQTILLGSYAMYTRDWTILTSFSVTVLYPPKFDECPLFKGTILKESFISNHRFSGDMLVFRNVPLPTIFTTNNHFIL